jgi:hypothetical protein
MEQIGLVPYIIMIKCPIYAQLCLLHIIIVLHYCRFSADRSTPAKTYVFDLHMFFFLFTGYYIELHRVTLYQILSVNPQTKKVTYSNGRIN